MSVRWHDQRWYHDFVRGEIRHVRGGDYEDGTTLPDDAIDVRIGDRQDITGLVAVLEELGYIKPRLDERVRVEDLRITHRLLDLLEARRDTT